MTTPLRGAECSACGCVVFPRLLLCPRCGGSEWHERLLEQGTLEEQTVVHRMPGRGPPIPVAIGSVRADGGPLLVVRLEPGVGAGERVLLADDDGAPVARKPQTSSEA